MSVDMLHLIYVYSGPLYVTLLVLVFLDLLEALDQLYLL